MIVPYVLIGTMNSAKPAPPMDLRDQRSASVVPMVDRSDVRPWYGGADSAVMVDVSFMCSAYLRARRCAMRVLSYL